MEVLAFWPFDRSCGGLAACGLLGLAWAAAKADLDDETVREVGQGDLQTWWEPRFRESAFRNTPAPGVPMPADPKSPFQVWHRSPAGPTPVALVEAGNLLGAAVLTMSRVDAHWRENAGVTALVGDARSTDIGDVIVDAGRAHCLSATDLGPAFAPLGDFPPAREHSVAQVGRTADPGPRDRPLRDTLGASDGPSPPANGHRKDHDRGSER